MIIYFYTVNDFTFIEAKFESDDNYSANRLEGAGVQIKNKNPLVYFNKRFDDLHPDIIGLACLAIFYPFIGRSVTLPIPVSPRLANSINREIFTKQKRIEIRNIDPSIKEYKGSGGGVLAFGGGMDSSAIRALFPETHLVHEASVRDGKLVPDATNAIVERLEVEDKGSLVKTNSRYISDPGGWHVWIGSLVTALLVAGQRKDSYIYAGTILGAAFLSNGMKYFDRHASRRWHGTSGNYWQQLFWDIGLPLVQPLMGCSEILTMRASTSILNRDEIFFCTASNGKACGVCQKCFRRACIDEYVSGRKVDYSAFDNSSVLAFLKKRPTYMGHIYAALASQGWKAPDFAKEFLSHMPKNVCFPLKYNQESLDFMPGYLVGRIKSILDENFSQMRPQDLAQMKAWDQSRAI